MKKTYMRRVEDIMPLEIKFHVFGEGSPKVFFSGGIHGGETTGIYVADRIVEFLEQNEVLKGSVKVLPIANVAGFRMLERASPYDRMDLNRIFPGRQDASPSLGLASVIWEEAKDADYIVDLHCCGVWGSSYTLALHQGFEKAKELASMLAIPAVIESGGTGGQLFTEATHGGTSAVIIELPGGGRDGFIDLQAGDECYEALLNLLRQLGMISGEPFKPNPTFYGKLEGVRAPVGGIFLPALKPGTPIKKDDILGTVAKVPVKAPYDGVAIMVRPPSYVFKGAGLASLAPVSE